jgi:hypothetical protein
MASDKVLHIRSRPLHASTPLILGPAPFFRIDGSVLYAGQSDAVVGRYSEHHWQVDAQYVSSLECTEPTRVQFRQGEQQRSEQLGPFSRLHFPNGTCYADAAQLAEFIPQAEHWRRVSDGQPWPTIVISPAP